MYATSTAQRNLLNVVLSLLVNPKGFNQNDFKECIIGRLERQTGVISYYGEELGLSEEAYYDLFDASGWLDVKAKERWEKVKTVRAQAFNAALATLKVVEKGDDKRFAAIATVVHDVLTKPSDYSQGSISNCLVGKMRNVTDRVGQNYGIFGSEFLRVSYEDIRQLFSATGDKWDAPYSQRFKNAKQKRTKANIAAQYLLRFAVTKLPLD